MGLFSHLSPDVRQYLVITGNYWMFTLTDGALRMLVLLHFHTLGFSPLDIALLFLFYEMFGVVTNLVGGWLGARLGLNKTMNLGLLLQVAALSLLLVPNNLLTEWWVMGAQAVSGIAKDLNKMSAKSAIKLIVPDGAEATLYRWVSVLTGSKNALKGAGFFLGAGLLAALGFRGAIAAMLVCLSLVFISSLLLLRQDLGKMSSKPRFSDLFSKSRSVNILSGARLFLFCARDVWFVVALPIYLITQLGWSHWSVGGFLAFWVIAYGLVQTCAPTLTRRSDGLLPGGRAAFLWAGVLSLVPATIALALTLDYYPAFILIVGLIGFATILAVNSALHSYLIVNYASEQGVSLDVGFYYMANAVGRLTGTVLSGWLYQGSGLVSCLCLSAVFAVIASLLVLFLPPYTGQASTE